MGIGAKCLIISYIIQPKSLRHSTDPTSRFWLQNNHPSRPIFSWPNPGPNTGVKRNLRKSHQFPHPAAAFGRSELALQERHDCSENMSGGAQPTARRAGGGGYLVRNGAQLVLTGTFIRPPRTSLNPPLYSEWGSTFFSVAVVPNNIQKTASFNIHR